MKKFNGGILGEITTKSIIAGVSGIFDTYQQNILQKKFIVLSTKKTSFYDK